VAIYNPSSIGVTGNLINFNDYSTSPIFRVLSRTPERRQIRAYDLPVPDENGISDFQTLIGSVAYIIQGVMYPGSETDYDNGLRAIRKLADLDFSQSDADTDYGYVPYVIGDSQGNKQIFLKVLYVDVPEDTRKGLVQPFRLVCKIKDPTIYGYTLNTVSTAAADFTAATGSAIYPFEYPILYGASTSSVSASGNNEGDIDVYPQNITIVGPVNTPTFTNTTTGEYITVDVNLATSSNVLSIYYNRDTLRVEQDGNSVIDKVTNGSTYFKIQPGLSDYSLTGNSISDGAYATMTFYNGYALS